MSCDVEEGGNEGEIRRRGGGGGEDTAGVSSGGLNTADQVNPVALPWGILRHARMEWLHGGRDVMCPGFRFRWLRGESIERSRGANLVWTQSGDSRR